MRQKQQKDDMIRAYLVVEDGSDQILDYHAINHGMMNVDELAKRPRGAPEHGELSIRFLGQVAVSLAAHGQSWGSILIAHAFHKTETLAKEVDFLRL